MPSGGLAETTRSAGEAFIQKEFSVVSAYIYA
jgi:hypothetical protein